MPHFDETFLSDCALAERQHVISYSLDRGGQLYQRRKLKSPKFFAPYRPRVVIKNVVRYSAISCPSTPNSSSLSSQSNLISTPSPNSSTPGTPASQQQPSVTPTNQQPQQPGNNCNNSSTSGHKNSLKGTKLARRARSFKDDLFERIWLMRTPNSTLGRSHSPQSPRNKHSAAKAPPTAEEMAKSARSLETHVKDISNALKHFRDVILKKKLEVLPGNGTVILETIASMFSVIQSHALNENSSVFLSAKQQVYQALGKLLKLCDDVMLIGDSTECASLSNDNVKEVVDLLEDAVKNLVTLAQQKLKEKEESSFKYGPDALESPPTPSHNHLMRPPIEVAGQRTSLPDITLTPKERDILEKTNSNPIRASHSTESILRDTSPPPKPPLPKNYERSRNPPPLPPKRRTQQQLQNQLSNNNSLNSDLGFSSDFSLMNCVVDYLSVRSRSPDENSSQCSLDSALNHSREEEELKALGLESRLDDNLLEDDVEKMFTFTSQTSGKDEIDQAKNNNNVNKISDGNGEGVGYGIGANDGVVAVGAVNSSAATVLTGMQKVAAATVVAAAGSSGASSAVCGGSIEKLEMRKTTNNNNRHSNESGFVSMQSFRTSTQSVSKRSSDYSVQSSSKSSSNSETAFGTSESANNEFHHSQQHVQQLQQRHLVSNATSTTTSFATSSSTVSSSSTTGLSLATEEHLSSTKHYSSTSSSSSSTALCMTVANDDNHCISNASSVSPEHFMERSEKLLNSQMQSTSTLSKVSSLEAYSSDDLAAQTNLVPPALPPKSNRNKNRHFSQFGIDEIDDVNSMHESPELRHHPLHYQAQHNQQQQHFYQWQSKHQSLIEPRHAASCIVGSVDGRLDEPPPLPVKKKYILAYMEVCSQSKHSNEQHRHTMHTYNLSRNLTHSQTMNIVPMAKDLSWSENEIPPALPPKNYKHRKPTAMTPTIVTTPPPSPKPSMPQKMDINAYTDGNILRHERVLSGAQGSEMMSTVCEELNDLNEEDQLNLHHSHHLPNVGGNTEAKVIPSSPNFHNSRNHDDGSAVQTPVCTPDTTNEEDEGIDIVLENHSDKKNCATTNLLAQHNLPNILEEVNITPYIIFKKENEDGPDVKGGYIDALIVQASGGKKGNAFSEAFITTFRTFIQPIDVIEKLAHRYTIFFCQMNEDQKQKAAKEAFSLLVRVVNDLTFTDLNNQLFALLGSFIYQVVCEGQLYLAKLLRQQYMEKVILYNNQGVPSYLPELNSTLSNAQLSLLDLKSVEIAEQMTLLDAELFQKIEIPEVLLFAKEQCEEKSPNLNKFTEHFNKMSYWARSKILSLEDAKDREKHVIKFIKIMKHLRKMNNYNSYLALLSALDSAPIRRLEWHKTITEGLKEYCTLIDSSSSFRVYRQALAETNPPCIPYIGLVLQDLTFVHVGNPDYLKDGVVNFSKRWQQHNIIVNMKRFKKCSYPFRRNERIIQFFGNFEKFLSEEEMWQISEHLKPRGKRPVHN